MWSWFIIHDSWYVKLFWGNGCTSNFCWEVLDISASGPLSVRDMCAVWTLDLSILSRKNSQIGLTDDSSRSNALASADNGQDSGQVLFGFSICYVFPMSISGFCTSGQERVLHFWFHASWRIQLWSQVLSVSETWEHLESALMLMPRLWNDSSWFVMDLSD